MSHEWDVGASGTTKLQACDHCNKWGRWMRVKLWLWLSVVCTGPDGLRLHSACSRNSMSAECCKVFTQAGRVLLLALACCGCHEKFMGGKNGDIKSLSSSVSSLTSFMGQGTTACSCNSVRVDLEVLWHCVLWLPMWHACAALSATEESFTWKCCGEVMDPVVGGRGGGGGGITSVALLLVRAASPQELVAWANCHELSGREASIGTVGHGLKHEGRDSAVQAKEETQGPEHMG